MTDNLIEQELFPHTLSTDRQRLHAFLDSFSLDYEEDTDYACCLVDSNDSIWGCGCCAGNILKEFALKESLRGENHLARILHKLLANRFKQGITHLFVFTKPENRIMFIQSGFYPVAETSSASMLENQSCGVERYLTTLPRISPYDPSIGAVVMNANPFTLGHRHLIETAVNQCAHLYVFVLEEERSLFPFHARLEMVRQGTADIPNAHICPGGPYMISCATFPSYFLKQGTDAAAVQGELDAVLFARWTRKAPRPPP